MTEQWYIVQTKPTAELYVQQRWVQVGIEVFFPRMKKLVRRAHRPVERLSPLFPSYLFAKFDLSDASLYRNVKFTRGVRKVLGCGNTPIPVSDAVVSVISDRVNNEGVLEVSGDYQPGDAVRITHGPLADLIGVLEKPIPASGRVRVLLQVYQKTIHADLPPTDVEKLE